MAELHTMSNMTQASITNQYAPVALPAAEPRADGSGPLWRSLLYPRRGQRAMEFSRNGSDLFGPLQEAGVRIERRPARPEPLGTAAFDLVLEDRTDGRDPIRQGSIHALLSPGGRWVVAVEKKRWVGLAGWGVLRQARREGFETVETFYAHPSLRTPRILVPLDRPEPFLFFLRLAVGVRAPRQRLIALAARCLCALRLHRPLLPNLIIVARRKR